MIVDGSVPVYSEAFAIGIRVSSGLEIRERSLLRAPGTREHVRQRDTEPLVLRVQLQRLAIQSCGTVESQHLVRSPSSIDGMAGRIFEPARAAKGKQQPLRLGHPG